MRRTEDGLIPTVLAIAGALQWVASWGGAWLVSATTRSTVSAGSGGMRQGRVLSRGNPSIPSCMKRSCQRQTTVLPLPTARVMAVVPAPSAVRTMIRARHTCYCALLRLRMIVSSQTRSSAVTVMEIPLRITDNRTTANLQKLLFGLLCQVLSTRAALSLVPTHYASIRPTTRASFQAIQRQSVEERRVLRSMSINTHGIIPHCKSMLSTRSIIHIFRHLDFRSLLHSRLDRPYSKAASRRSARIADNTDERQTDGINSDHPAARASLWRWVWVLPRRLLPSRRTRWDRRRSRVNPCRPRDRVAGARAHRGPLLLSFERASLIMA